MARTAHWLPAGSNWGDDSLVLHDESKLPMRVLRAVQGIEAPSFSVRMGAQSPGTDGVRFDGATAYRSDVSVPVLLQAETREQFRWIKSQMVSWLMPTRGAGKLVFTDAVGTDAGTSRWVSAVYKSGLEGDGSQMGPSWWFFTLKFECPDPWFYSTDPLTARWIGSTTSSFFPFRFDNPFAPDGLTNVEPLEVFGDADTWPTFEMFGPFRNVTVVYPRSQRHRNVQADASWTVERVTAPGEMLRLVTKPGEESLRLYRAVDDETYEDLGNAWSCLAPRSWFVPLTQLDDLQVTAEGTGNSTAVDLLADEAWTTHG